jgi:hypothetical protein
MPREILASKSLNSAIFLQVNGGPKGTRTRQLRYIKGEAKSSSYCTTRSTELDPNP